MKTLVAFLVLLIAASSGFAQRTLINRVDRQTGEPARIEHSIVAQPAQPQGKRFDLTMEEHRAVIGYNDYGSFHATLTNLSGEPLQLVFVREQNRENVGEIWNPDSLGWQTGVCFGDLCYPFDKSFLPLEDAYTVAPGGTTEFKLNVSSNLKADDSILVHIVLAAIGSSDDTIGLWLTAVANEPSSVSQTPSSKHSFIRSIYPSPLMSGNAINVSVESVRESAYRYNIYDPFGREVAFGTSQRKLVAGINQFNISSLEGLNSGSYLLKLSFSDGSSDAYPFTVLR